MEKRVYPASALMLPRVYFQSVRGNNALQAVKRKHGWFNLGPRSPQCFSPGLKDPLERGGGREGRAGRGPRAALNPPWGLACPCGPLLLVIWNGLGLLSHTVNLGVPHAGRLFLLGSR